MTLEAVMAIPPIVLGYVLGESPNVMVLEGSER